MDDQTTRKKLQLINTLDGNVRQIELTSAQHAQLETAYTAVAKWLGDSDHPLLRDVQIYPQGSVRLRTTVRPIGQDEFDVDLVCLLPNARLGVDSAESIYHLVGERLRAHGTYKKMLEPKNRCWRLDYADGSRFHMDITPAMPNPMCGEGGILVPDRERKEFKPSNPVRYAEIFDDISRLAPEFTGLELAQFTEALSRASIEPLPDPMAPKDFLRRIVQLAKRHRDLHYQQAKGRHPPISIVLTTLIMESYANLTKQVFQSPWDFMESVIREMPLYVRDTTEGYVVPNPSAPDENFAEKWNAEPQKARDFLDWHSHFLADIHGLVAAQGFDRILPILNEKLIGPDSLAWQKHMIGGIGQARQNAELSRVSVVGGISTVGGVPVQKNTFYGDGG